MSNAPNYTPATSFATDESNQVAGRSTVKTVSLDVELANVSSSINALNTNIKLLQRDDGKPKDFLIEPYALSEQTRTLLAASGEVRGSWVAATAYSQGDVVQHNAIAYLCITAHTSSGTFAAAMWLAVSGDGSAAASAIAAAASAALADADRISAEAADVSATASEISATASALSATNSALSATNSAGAAVISAAAAASSASSANLSAISATASQGVATTKAGEASASQIAAAASQSTASAAAISATASELAASASQISATASAGTATTKAGEALTSANNAAASEALATAALDSFDDRYLGSKTSDPALDNDGAALLVGAQYWNSVSGKMRVYGSAGWQDAYIPTSNQIAGLFYKTNPRSVAFTKTGAGTASIKAGTKIEVAGTIVSFVSATAITMPTLTAGTDYAIWVKDDATIQATTDFSAAPGAGNWRRIGWFHYAPGGNAAASAGGDTTPAINEYSLFDIKYRPACPDGRGMTAILNSFCADIYLTCLEHIVNGTSKYNVTIADGSSPPKIPLAFGGNGSTAYSTYTRFQAADVLASHGKRLPTYEEFGALAFGTTEATSGGTDPTSTILRAAYTSRHGVMLSSGNMWQWGADFGGGAAAASWSANTNGRGSTYQMENAVLFGGNWAEASNSGSLASNWGYSPAVSYSDFGSRGVCDLLILE